MSYQMVFVELVSIIMEHPSPHE